MKGRKIDLDEKTLIESLQLFYQKNGFSPSCHTNLYSGQGLYSPDIYKRVMYCKSWPEVCRKAGIPAHSKYAPEGLDEFIEYTRDFVNKNEIKSVKRLIKHKDFPSEDYITKRFGSVRNFASKVGMDMIDSHVTEDKILADILRVKELLGRVPTSREMIKHGKYSVRTLFKGLSYNDLLLNIGETPCPRNDNCILSNQGLINLYIDVSKKSGYENGATSKVIDSRAPYGSCVFIKRFGSMGALRKACGYKPTSSPKHNRDDLMRALKNKTIEIGRELKQNDIDTDLSLPSYSTVLKITGLKFKELKKQIKK